MEIQGGPSFFNYDARYLQVTQRLAPESVKPNVFREVDDQVAMALLLTDAVALSDEARDLLKKLRKEMSSRDSKEFRRILRADKRFKDLLYSLKDLREAVYGKDEEDEEESGDVTGKKKKTNTPAPHFLIQLSGPERTGEQRRAVKFSGNRDILDKMIVYSPNPRAKDALKDELAALGEKIITSVKNFGVHIIVLDLNRSLPEITIKGMMIVAPSEMTFDGRPWGAVRGIYQQSRRLIVIGEEKIGDPRRSTARHEFAHAFDHTFTSNNSRRLPLSVQLWNLFHQDREGLISDYAGTNPAEYFAECVEAFFRPAGREDLDGKDPKMAQYLETLFES